MSALQQQQQQQRAAARVHGRNASSTTLVRPTVHGCFRSQQLQRAPRVQVSATAAPEAPAQEAGAKYQRPDTSGRFGQFGGKYVPETRELPCPAAWKRAADRVKQATLLILCARVQFDHISCFCHSDSGIGGARGRIQGGPGRSCLPGDEALMNSALQFSGAMEYA